MDPALHARARRAHECAHARMMRAHGAGACGQDKIFLLRMVLLFRAGRTQSLRDCVRPARPSKSSGARAYVVGACVWTPHCMRTACACACACAHDVRARHKRFC